MATRRGPDGTARVAIQGTHNGTNWANVFWANLTGGAAAPQADLDAWLTSFANQYKTSFAAAMATSVNFVQAKATLFQSGGTVLQSVSAMTGAGTNGSAEVDDNASAIVVSWVTSVYWRGGKPRTYFPGVIQSQVTQGRTIGTADAAAWKADAQGFRTAINALTHGAITGTALGFVSFRSGNADRPTPLFFPFNDATAHHRLGSQRRRMGKWQL